MQFPKRDGGLGFKHLGKFNDALLRQQAWRIISHPYLTLSKLFKARYFKDTHLFDAKPKIYQSYGWSSILAGVDLLKKGTRYVIGSGS